MARNRYWCIILVILSSCVDIDGYNVFTIHKGTHNSTQAIKKFRGNTLNFIVQFDESVIYQLDGLDHIDTNKLIGFSYGLSPHENSARFGWRWFEGQVIIVAYSYVNGVREIYDIGYCTIGEACKGEIEETHTEYIYRFKDVEHRITKGVSSKNKYWEFPYFGGQQKAPHDIHIKLWL